MKKTVLFALSFLFLAGVFVSGLEVARDEIFGSNPVEFRNYLGPHARIDTAADVAGIGVQLGANTGAVASTHRYFGKYSVIHAVSDAAEGGKLDADIFIIEPDALVDHIANVRLMISSYLRTAYGYPQADADLLARFVTFYNAIYRGNLGYFQGRYKGVVLSHLTAGNVGMSVNYTEWAGRTQIVIPLRAPGGQGLSTLPVSELGNQQVREQLQQTQTGGLEDQRNLAQLEDRALQQEEARIRAEQERLAQQEQQLAQQQQQNQQQQQQVDQQQAQVQQQLTQAEQQGNQQQVQQLEQQQQNLQQQEQALQQQEQTLNQQQQQVQAEQAAVTQDQTQAQQREQELAAVRTEIAQQETAQQAQQTAPTAVNLVTFLRVDSATVGRYGTLVVADTVSGSVTGTSSLASIRGRRFESFAGGILVVADTTTPQAGTFLIRMDPTTLAITNVSDTALFADSFFLISGNQVFAVVSGTSGYRVASFDADLNRVATSTGAVDPYTAIVLSGSDLYVQSATGGILRLSTRDLTTTTEIRR